MKRRIHQAAFEGDLPVLRSILREAKEAQERSSPRRRIQARVPTPEELINFPDAIHSRTPLIFASMKGHAVVVAYLLSKACIDVLWTDARGLNCLHYAAMNGHLDVACLLLANPVAKKRRLLNSVTTKTRETALHLAVRGNFIRIVRELLRRGVDYFGRSSRFQTAEELAGGDSMRDVFLQFRDGLSTLWNDAGEFEDPDSEDKSVAVTFCRVSAIPELSVMPQSLRSLATSVAGGDADVIALLERVLVGRPYAYWRTLLVGLQRRLDTDQRLFGLLEELMKTNSEVATLCERYFYLLRLVPRFLYSQHTGLGGLGSLNTPLTPAGARTAMIWPEEVKKSSRRVPVEFLAAVWGCKSKSEASIIVSRLVALRFLSSYDEHSETVILRRRLMSFIREKTEDDKSWYIHLALLNLFPDRSYLNVEEDGLAAAAKLIEDPESMLRFCQARADWRTHLRNLRKQRIKSAAVGAAKRKILLSQGAVEDTVSMVTDAPVISFDVVPIDPPDTPLDVVVTSLRRRKSSATRTPKRQRRNSSLSSSSSRSPAGSGSGRRRRRGQGSTAGDARRRRRRKRASEVKTVVIQERAAVLEWESPLVKLAFVCSVSEYSFDDEHKYLMCKKNAAEVSNVLQSLGFRVYLHTDLSSRDDILAAFDSFCCVKRDLCEEAARVRLSTPSSVTFFFWSGMTRDHYLVPPDVNPRVLQLATSAIPPDGSHRLISMESLMVELEIADFSPDAVNIVVLESCEVTVDRVRVVKSNFSPETAQFGLIQAASKLELDYVASPFVAAMRFCLEELPEVPPDGSPPSFGELVRRIRRKLGHSSSVVGTTMVSDTDWFGVMPPPEVEGYKMPRGVLVRSDELVSIDQRCPVVKMKEIFEVVVNARAAARRIHKTLPEKKLAVLLRVDDFCPPQMQHLAMFDEAYRLLNVSNHFVIGGWFMPTHSPSPFLGLSRRLLINTMIQNHPLLMLNPCQKKRRLTFEEIVMHIQRVLRVHFRGRDVRIVTILHPDEYVSYPTSLLERFGVVVVKFNSPKTTWDAVLRKYARRSERSWVRLCENQPLRRLLSGSDIVMEKAVDLDFFLVPEVKEYHLAYLRRESRLMKETKDSIEAIRDLIDAWKVSGTKHYVIKEGFELEIFRKIVKVVNLLFEKDFSVKELRLVKSSFLQLIATFDVEKFCRSRRTLRNLMVRLDDDEHQLLERARLTAPIGDLCKFVNPLRKWATTVTKKFS